MKTIKFKSTPNNFNKEFLNLKRNTVRIFNDPKDVRKEILDDYLNGKLNIIRCKIVNTETGEGFSNLLTDVTKYKKIYIMSW